MKSVSQSSAYMQNCGLLLSFTAFSCTARVSLSRLLEQNTTDGVAGNS